MAAVPAARADFKDDIDYTKLKNEYGAALPDGAGVRLIQVEYMRDGFWAPEATGDVAGKAFSYISSTFGGYSAHAYQVACFLGGSSTSMTPGLSGWKASEAVTFTGRNNLNAGRITAPVAASWDIENHSWGGDDQLWCFEILYKEDYRIDRDNIIACVGVDNGPTMSQMMANGYNSIAVGSSSGNHPQSGTTLDTVGRMKPDIVGTNTWTSYATPIVASTATLLVGEINRSSSLSAARSSMVIKALLMAGATKSQFPGWSHSATRPLDQVFGAGQVNAYNSYKALVAGQQSASSSANLSLDGWDSNTTSTGGRKLYFFNVPNGKRMTLSAVLAWNRHIIPDATWQVLTPKLENLDLVLWKASGFQLGNQVSSSISSIDNVEHIYETSLSAGQYALEVAASVDGERYGIAWKSTLVDDPNSVSPTTTIPTTTIPTTTTTIPTTTIPTTTVSTTTIPTTTIAPTTTIIPTTTIAPTTSIAPTSSIATTIPTTTIPTTIPTTTIATSTTSTTVVTTTTIKATTSIPLTTISTPTSPSTTVTTTIAPTTTIVPTTTIAPTTTIPLPQTPTPNPTPSSTFVAQSSGSDIGTVGAAGSSVYTSGAYSVSGSGADITGTQDSFEFVSMPISGNSVLSTRITGFTSADSNGTAGLMLRDSSASGAPFAAVVITGSRKVEFVRRTSTGVAATVTAGQTVNLPVYLQIVRNNGIVTATYSSDGTTWSTLGSAEISLRTDLLGGLSVCSHKPGQFAVLTCDAPNVGDGSQPAYAGLSLYSVGVADLAPSASVSGSASFTLTGAGYFAPGTTLESVSYLARKNFVDAAISTHVKDARPGFPPMRAGLMIRESVVESSRFAALSLNAQGRVVFEYRSSPGAFAVTTTFNETARYLLLDRKGATITAMVSTDGSNWRTLATGRVSFRQDPYLGLFNVSSYPTSVVTSDFDGFDVVNR